MEAIWRIEVEDFPAFIIVDDKGNDFRRNPKAENKNYYGEISYDFVAYSGIYTSVPVPRGDERPT